jgi:TetR/AcrR family transcriptional regulator, cholesterol catabolism regulator
MSERSFSTVEAPVQATGGATYHAILSAATDSFGRLGFHGTSMRQIATAAGVSLANIYNYFGSKSQILLQILRAASADQLAATEAACDAAGSDVSDRLAAAIAAWVRFNVERNTECFVANSELRYLENDDRATIIADRDRQQKLIAELVDEGVRTGVFRTPYPGEAVIAILTMCNGVAIWYRSDGRLSADAIADHYARYTLGLLEADQQSGSISQPR